MTAIIELNENEQKVLDAMKPEYDHLVLIIPGLAKINDWAAADALASLKKKNLIGFEGRGRFKSCYLKAEGEAQRTESRVDS